MQTNVSTTTVLGDRYALLRRVGSGGMGTVWEADDRVLKRRVAVKILAEPLCDNEPIAARFRREAQAAGRLAHPSIAQVFDYGEDEGRPFIVLELVPGVTLRQLIEDRGALPPEEVAAIGAQIAEALSAAHAEGIVHRDVKPGNVMVEPDGRVKVMDFGIADAIWFEPLTDTGTIMATARYISPEQATGGGATGASDVYSLGAVLYELFAGRLPFDGDSPFAIAHAHAYEVPEPLGAVAPGVPASMRVAVEAAMHKDPRERPAAAELAATLRAAATSDGRQVLPPFGMAPTAALAADDATAALATPVPATDPGSRRAAAWMLAGLAALVLVLAVAFVTLAGPDAGGRRAHGPGRTATASPQAGVSTTAGGPGHDGGPGKGTGKATGHDEPGGAGEGHGPED